MLSLNLLGPVELRRNGANVPLTLRKTVALLVLLSLGGPTTRVRVAAMLWPDLDEPIGRRNLRRELARLRELGASDAVEVAGERLALASGLDLDMTGFATALREGRPDDALALWRGMPAEGLDLDDAPAFTEWLVAERERLNARWRQALDDSASAAEGRGDPLAALSKVDRLLADDPLQERHHRAAMRLLAAAGRREEAMARYEHCRALLQAELGLQPMADTEALVAVLRGDARPVAALQPALRNLLPAQLPFVGREDEVALLERAWLSGRTLLIEGEAGVGKSRLAIDFATAHGPLALVHCRPGDAELPMATFARALQVLAGPEPALDGLPEWVRAELARLMPALGPPPPPMRSEAERMRFGHAVSMAWRAWAEGSFDAVVIDDWHLADPASQSLLVQVADSGALPMRLVLVYRPECSDAARALLQRLHDAGAPHLRLQPLPPPAVFQLVQRLSGSVRPQRFAALLSRATDGLPFYLAETLRHLADTGLLSAGADGVWHTPFDDSTQDYRELPLPASVRDAVLARVRRLPESARRVLEAAALAEEPFAAAMLAPACALSEVEAALALEAALDARLLREHDRGGLAFAHDLVQQALASDLGAERRRSVHRRLALGAAAAGAEPARVAAHHEAGGEPARAVAWRRRAGEQARRLYAQDEAIVQWQRALADGPADDERLDIGTLLMRTLSLRSRYDEADAMAAELTAAVEAGTGSRPRRIETHIAIGAYYASQEIGDRALAWLDRLPAIDEPRLNALALQARSDALRGMGRVEEAQRLGQAALACGGLDDGERASLLDSLLLTAHLAGRFRDGQMYAEQSLALSRALNDGVGIARALGRRATMLCLLSPSAEAEQALVEAAEMSGRMGMVGQQRSTLFNLCVLYSSQGRPRDVLRVAREAWGLQPPMGQEPMRTQLKLAFVEAHLALGELGEAFGWLLGAIDDALAFRQWQGVVGVLNTAGELLAVLGEQARAQPLRATLDEGIMRELHVNGTEMFLVDAECALMDGDLPAARAAWQRVSALGELDDARVGVRWQVVDAAMALAEGDAARALRCLPDDDAPGQNEEIRQRARAVRLRAEAALGGCTPASLQAAEAALRQPPVQALASLALHHALARADPRPQRMAAWEARIDALSASLADHPDQRAAFERRWRRLAP